MPQAIRKLTDSREGFTLIEVIIYISLFSLIASFVLGVFYQIIGGQNQWRDREEVDTEANFMMQKMLWALTGAEAITEPPLNAAGSTLSLNKYNYSQNPIVFDNGSQDLRMSNNGGAPVSLNSSRVYVSELLFDHVPAVQSAPEAVKITLSVVSTDIKNPIVASTTLQNIIYLRK